MTSAQTWIQGLSIYFITLFIIVSLFSLGGVLNDNEVIVNDQFKTSLSSNINESAESDDLSFFPSSSYFKDVFSFFVWNISLYDGSMLMQYFWIFRIFLVYLPLLFLVLAIYYSLPTMGGGG